ncbi:UvrD-helicase domain-containing protein [Sphingobacterium sp.]|uniref:UvrD-helicase domain-containing protein n=1 Tax=Sphingobacterium sp. TaxID=341027 RepID=UPI0031D725DB
MQQEISITDDQIKIAEEVLLKGLRFDLQRVSFIKDLSTHDLHAVPGSGKTTALLAKLLSLEQHLPLVGNSGILVISHTNAAVDEIKEKIGHLCPRLFSYPNFIGTIQGFVDMFLAVPYYKILYKKSPIRIDDDIYNENHFPDFKLRSFLNRRSDSHKILFDYRIRGFDDLKLGLSDEGFPFKNSTDTFQKVLKIKKDLRESGFLCFDDAYILAEEYLNKFPGITSIIKKRFSFVFVDEMQDMDKHQYDLLETLFANSDEVCFQRIGDKNQAIFNPESLMNNIWVERNVKEINGSHRLHNNTALVVQRLALNPISVQGLRVNADGSSIEIKPVLFVYETNNISKVVPAFAEEIKRLIDIGKIPKSDKNIYKAISWTTSRSGDKPEMIKLNSYHSSFSKILTKPKISYNSVEDYLFLYDVNDRTMASIRKSILNAIIKVLRLEKIENPFNSRSFTKSSLIDFIKREHNAYYENYKFRIYQICRLIIQQQTNNAKRELVSFIHLILQLFNKTVTSKSTLFLSSSGKPTNSKIGKESIEISNWYRDDNVSIELATVHGVKGQTHTCTLYMESFYQKNVEKKGQYESTRIAEQLCGIPLDVNAHDFVKQSLKMTYVGFSRPTHLLGFAIEKSRYESSFLGKPNVNLWDVKFVV